jgi:hypothetical protein
MRKTREVHLTLLAAIALATVGCPGELQSSLAAQSLVVTDSANQASPPRASKSVSGEAASAKEVAPAQGANVTRGGFGGTANDADKKDKKTAGG